MDWVDARDSRTMARASRKTALSKLAQAVATHPIDHWLAHGTPARTNIVKAAGKAGTAMAGDAGEIGQYIAVSALLHHQDGWAYLARASSAHLAGDLDSARHLAYYAELRAAMSLLASQGVGTFQNDHCVVDDHGDIHLICLPTHKFVWAAMSRWTTLPGASSFAKGIFPYGATLQEWLDSFGLTSANWAEVFQSWLIEWGIDIRRFNDDRDKRNESSYRPRWMAVNRVRLKAERAVTVMQELWTPCEPSGTHPFVELDRHLLRMALEVAATKIFGIDLTKPAGKKDFLDRLKRVLPTVTRTSIETDGEVLDFLTRKTAPANLFLIIEANKDSAIDGGTHHYQAMSRAMLLLRLAAACNHVNVKETGTSFGSLQFWLDPWSQQLGLTTTSAPWTSSRDAWPGGAESAKALTAWLHLQPKKSTLEIADLQVHCADHLQGAARLETLAVVALWA